jgi:hypothetical protein
MSAEKSLIDVLFFIVPAILVVITAFYLIKKFLDTQHRLKMVEMRMQLHKDILPLRLQAYERLVLFLERISPNNLLHRVYQPGYTVKEFHLELLKVIRQEFEHNITQQVYVTPESWNAVRKARDEVIKLINRAATGVINEEKGAQLNKAVFELIMEENWDEVQTCIDVIKSEINRHYY